MTEKAPSIQTRRSSDGRAARPGSSGKGGRKIRWSVWAMVVAAVILAGSAYYFTRDELRLELKGLDDGVTYASLRVHRGQPFALWFLHSYDRAFFEEHYVVVDRGVIRLTHMTFKSNLNGEGFEYSDFHLREDGVGELRNINKDSKNVTFMMGSPDMANHTLIINDKRIPLTRYVAPGTLVAFEVVSRPRWQGKK